MKLMEMVDEERARLHAEEVNSKFQTEPDGDHKRYYGSTTTKQQRDREKLVEEGDQLDVHISDSEYVILMNWIGDRLIHLEWYFSLSLSLSLLILIF